MKRYYRVVAGTICRHASEHMQYSRDLDVLIVWYCTQYLLSALFVCVCVCVYVCVCTSVGWFFMPKVSHELQNFLLPLLSTDTLQMCTVTLTWPNTARQREREREREKGSRGWIQTSSSPPPHPTPTPRQEYNNI